MTHEEHVLQLVREALGELDHPDARLSATIRKAIRIARLRQDFDNLFWLEFEMMSVESISTIIPVKDEIRPHYSKDEWNRLGARTLQMYGAERTIKYEPLAEGSLDRTATTKFLLSVREIEDKLDFFASQERQLEGLVRNPTRAFSGSDMGMMSRVAFTGQRMLIEIRSILERIRQRVHRFLSVTETETVRGQTFSGAFERNRAFVENKLGELCPEAQEKLL